MFLEYLLDPAGVSTGTKIKRKLLEKRFIEQQKISVPNGSVTLLRLTKQGRTLLALSGIEVEALPKNASLELEYWKELVAGYYRSKGYKVEKEVPIGKGKVIDLVAEKGNERIAIEIETGKSDVKTNVKKCGDAGFEKAIVVCTKGKLD